MTNIDYTLWPNTDGELGKIKVTIPTNAEDWPAGDALVGNFVYNNGKLAGFVDTKALTVNESKSTTFPYDYVNIQVDKSLEGVMTFNKGERTKYLIITYTGSKSGNTGDTIVLGTKYLGCTTVEEVKAIDSDYLTNDIVDGIWSQSLADLTHGGSMFQNCTNLTSFSSDLSSLTDGSWMFYDCTNLTSFSSDLSSLTSGYNMFAGCKLDVPSVKNIIDTTINTFLGELTLGMGCNNTTEDKNLFAQEVGYDNITSLLAALGTKGWDVYAQYNGRPTTTYGLRRPSEDILPVFVKIEEDEKHGRYTSEDGSKKYRLDWFHETTGSSDGYTQFNTIEEAIQHFNIKPIEK